MWYNLFSPIFLQQSSLYWSAAEDTPSGVFFCAKLFNLWKTFDKNLIDNGATAYI
jgi:hypothetical protein